MHARIKIGTGALAAAAAAIFVFPAAANADYAPGPKDVVGVGSDTVQAETDFVADGSYAADPGYNGIGNKFKFISIDATADANTRLAYGPGGANGLGAATITGTNAGPPVTTTVAGSQQCGPGTGAKIGTGNATGPDTATADLPCVLSPTVVLRAGLSPEQRPNGSGAGYKLLVADTNSSGAALNANSATGFGLVNFSRASSGQNAHAANFDSITVGKDDLAMLSASSTSSSGTHAVALSVAELTQIYTCNTTTWNALPGNSGGSTATIVPLLPQVGSGTRKTFLADISVTTPGSCVRNVEENDPEAIADSGDPANAIEPMSNTRLNLFQGIGGAAGAGSISPTGYFNDPTCPFGPGLSLTIGTGANTPTQCQGASQTNAGAAALAPAVTEYLSSTFPTATDGSGTYDDLRNLYIYFRHADIVSPTIWQPGSTTNWVRAMFYNPCTGTGTTYSMTATTLLTGANATAAGCSTDTFGNVVGPAGAPYFAGGAAQADISDAGVLPTYVYNQAPV